MNKPSKIIASSLMAALMLSSLAGCAGGGNSGPTSAPSTEPATSAQTDAGAQATNTPKPGNVNADAEFAPRPLMTLAPEPDSYDSGEDRLVVGIPVGDGSDKILYYPNRGGMSENGADDFCFFDGDLYVLDTLDYQILKFSGNGTGDEWYFERACNLPDGYDAGWFHALAVDENNFYVLGGSNAQFYVIDRYTGESKRIFTLGYDAGVLLEKSYRGELLIRYGKVIIITDEIVLLYDPNGEEQKLVETNAYGFISESTAKTTAYRNYETGEVCKFTEDALRKVSSAESVGTISNIVFMPDGSIITCFFERYEDGHYSPIKIDSRVIRISRDGEVVAMSDILHSLTAGNSETERRTPENAIEVVDGHVYLMMQFTDSLEIREVAMHGVD